MEKISKISDRLRKIMHDNKISQTKLSELTGISRSMISEYMSGKYEPKYEKVNAICQVLNVNTSWLMGYDVVMSEYSDDTFKDLQGRLYDSVIENEELNNTVMSLVEDAVINYNIPKRRALVLALSIINDNYELIDIAFKIKDLSEREISEINLLIDFIKSRRIKEE